MKAITLHQPWATLIAIGEKISETRSWAPPESLLGQRLAIHASKTPPQPRDWNDQTHAALNRAGYSTVLGYCEPALPLGAVVATVTVVDACKVRFSTLHADGAVWRGGTLMAIDIAPRYDHLDDGFGDYGFGRWVWILDDVEALPEPITAVGRQRIWNWTPPTEEMP